MRSFERTAFERSTLIGVFQGAQLVPGQERAPSERTSSSDTGDFVGRRNHRNPNLPEDPHVSPFDDEPEPEGDRLLTDAGFTAEDSASTSGAEEPARMTLKEFRDQAERQYILQTLQLVDWRISKAATMLGVERTNLHESRLQHQAGGAISLRNHLP
ncbi:MAG: helix-turn-helix domain-containing protein [Polyangiaceae bacterium]